jgi:hypothetical protein
MTILACDLGGTRMKIGVVRDGSMLAQTTEPAHAKHGFAPQLPVLKAAWRRLLDQAKLPAAKPPVGFVERPWGSFKQYAFNEDCAVSLMTVRPGQRLSLQSHTGRAELKQGFVMRSRIVAALFAFAALLPAGMAALAERPNIVLIIADDLGAADVGAYGATGVRTPHLDRLAREGMRFTQAFNSCSSCSPSRASIITGRYPHSTGAEMLHHGRERQSDHHRDAAAAGAGAPPGVPVGRFPATAARRGTLRPRRGPA